MIKLADLKRELLARPFNDPTLPPHLRARREALRSGHSARQALSQERAFRAQARSPFNAPPEFSRVLRAEAAHNALGARSLAEGQSEIGAEWKRDYTRGKGAKSSVEMSGPKHPATARANAAVSRAGLAPQAPVDKPIGQMTPNQRKLRVLRTKKRSALERRAARNELTQLRRQAADEKYRSAVRNRGGTARRSVSELAPRAMEMNPRATLGHPVQAINAPSPMSVWRRNLAQEIYQDAPTGAFDTPAPAPTPSTPQPRKANAFNKRPTKLLPQTAPATPAPATPTPVAARPASGVAPRAATAARAATPKKPGLLRKAFNIFRRVA